jgi:type I restriction enzyme S subunit
MSQKLGLVPSSKVDQRTLVSESYVGGKLCEPGDLVLNRLKAHLGVFGLASQAGVVSPDYTVLRPRGDIIGRYFEYILRSPACRSELRIRAKGIVEGFWRLYTDDFYDITLPVPSRSEQAATVRFLNYADRRIALYIRSKQKLIKLLEEQRQVTIHQVVTRGLDEDVPLKPSGVGWIGMVPKHWVISALRLRYSQCLGKMLDTKRITGSHTLPYLRNTDVQWDKINTLDLPTMDISPEEYERYTVRKGDLLVCEGGEVGRCALWENQLPVCGFQKALHRLRPLQTNSDLPRFMYYTLRAAVASNAFNDGHVSTIAHLTGDKLRAHRFPFPPLEEQKRIVEFLDNEMAEITTAIAMAEREISLVREYRIRLIADVVTGKLDVREAAANLPDELEEPAGLLPDELLADGDETDLTEDELIDEEVVA